MPSLSVEHGPLALRVEWRTMSKPTALGLACLLPRSLAVAVGIVIILGVAAWAPLRWRPVLSQREYQLGVEAEQRALNQSAAAHFRRSIELDPNDTNCQSHYSDWLIGQGRPQEALDQLALVRRRLNSNELWTRQARALTALGRTSESQQAYQTYLKRVWQARNAGP
jgi:tetratricopeptide (TPR) repeat protein